jgi:hypothetical protein
VDTNATVVVLKAVQKLLGQSAAGDN